MSCIQRKLTTKDVALIRGIVRIDRIERARGGFHRGSNGLEGRIAKEFGVTVWCIESITRKRRWKKVKPKKL